MNEQPEALRLADAIDPLTRSGLDNLTCAVAADELRRLHAKYELLRIAPMKYKRMEFNAKLQEENERFRKHIESQTDELGKLIPMAEKLEAQRDALLAALQDLCDTLGECGMTEKARAAIKAVKGETK